MTAAKPGASLYIDGFNLYRRCLEKHPESKWLNLEKLAEHIMPGHEIVEIHYFTALIKPGASVDVHAPVRQQVYLRALATLPKVTVHLGTFRMDRRWMPKIPLAIDPATGQHETALVRKIEEKGSDVNLATRMLADAFLGKADCYVMLTNDSDQAGPLRMMKQELSFSTGIIFPMESARSSKELVKTAPDFIGYVTAEGLEASQFPDTLVDSKGRRFHRPEDWKLAEPTPDTTGDIVAEAEAILDDTTTELNSEGLN